MTSVNKQSIEIFPSDGHRESQIHGDAETNTANGNKRPIPSEEKKKSDELITTQVLA